MDSSTSASMTSIAPSIWTDVIHPVISDLSQEQPPESKQPPLASMPLLQTFWNNWWRRPVVDQQQEKVESIHSDAGVVRQQDPQEQKMEQQQQSKAAAEQEPVAVTEPPQQPPQDPPPAEPQQEQHPKADHQPEQDPEQAPGPVDPQPEQQATPADQQPAPDPTPQHGDASEQDEMDSTRDTRDILKCECGEICRPQSPTPQESSAASAEAVRESKAGMDSEASEAQPSEIQRDVESTIPPHTDHEFWQSFWADPIPPAPPLSPSFSRLTISPRTADSLISLGPASPLPSASASSSASSSASTEPGFPPPTPGLHSPTGDIPPAPGVFWSSMWRPSPQKVAGGLSPETASDDSSDDDVNGHPQLHWRDESDTEVEEDGDDKQEEKEDTSIQAVARTRSLQAAFREASGSSSPGPTSLPPLEDEDEPLQVKESEESHPAEQSDDDDVPTLVSPPTDSDFMRRQPFLRHPAQSPAASPLRQQLHSRRWPEEGGICPVGVNCKDQNRYCTLLHPPAPRPSPAIQDHQSSMPPIMDLLASFDRRLSESERAMKSVDILGKDRKQATVPPENDPSSYMPRVLEILTGFEKRLTESERSTQAHHIDMQQHKQAQAQVLEHLQELTKQFKADDKRRGRARACLKRLSVDWKSSSVLESEDPEVYDPLLTASSPVDNSSDDEGTTSAPAVAHRDSLTPRRDRPVEPAADSLISSGEEPVAEAEDADLGVFRLFVFEVLVNYLTL